MEFQFATTNRRSAPVMTGAFLPFPIGINLTHGMFSDDNLSIFINAETYTFTHTKKVQRHKQIRTFTKLKRDLLNARELKQNANIYKENKIYRALRNKPLS